MDCSTPALLPMGFSRQEYGSELPCPPPGNLPDPGIESMLFISPALAGKFHWATWEASRTSSHFQTKANKVLHHLHVVLRIKSNSPNIIFKNKIPVFVSSFLSNLSFHLPPHHSYNLPTVILKVISSLQYIPCFSLLGILPVLFFSAWNIFCTSISPCIHFPNIISISSSG